MAFTYRLELEEGTPADPPTFVTVVPSWHPGDAIPLGRGKGLRVIDARPGESQTTIPFWWSRPHLMGDSRSRLAQCVPSASR